MNLEDDNQTATSSEAPDDILQQFQEFSEDITERIRDTPIIAQAMKTFLRRYKVLTKPGGFVNARLSSALHQFGWVFGGTVARNFVGVEGYLRAGSCQGATSRGKAVALQGRPKGMKIGTFPKSSSNLTMKTRPPKCPHSLSKNIATGIQNAEGW